MTPQELKNSILQLAIQGKLVPQHAEELINAKDILFLEEAPFNIPTKWGWQTLEKCCEIYTGNSIPEKEKKEKYEGLKEGFDYIGTKDILLTQEIIYNNGVKIPYENNFKRAYDKTILLCIEGGSAGRKIAILDREVCFGNKLCAFNANKIFYKFLFYYLQSNEFKKIFVENRTGIIGGVSIKKLKNIVLPIPPFAEQKRIVAKIEELLPYVERYEAAYNKLQQLNKRFPVDLQKSVLQLAIQGRLVPQRAEEGNAEDLYKQIQAEKQKLIKEGKIKKEKPLPPITDDEKPFEIPDSWKLVRLGEVIIFIGGYAYKSNSYVSKSNNQILRLGNIKQDTLLLDAKPVYISDELSIQTKNFKIQINDILITMTGTRRKKDYLYTTKINKNDVKARNLFLNQRVGCFRIVYGLVPEFLLKVLQSEIIRDLIFKKETGTANQGNIGSEDMKEFIYIPLPPFAEQKRIIAKIEEFLSLCDKLK